MLRHKKPSDPGNTAPSFKNCPAKTFHSPNGDVVPGRSVIEHCQIVGEVAHALISRYPLQLQSALFPPDAAFAAAAHDVGKVSPCFVEKLRRACTVALPNLPVSSLNPALETTWGGHAGVSAVTAKALGTPKWIAEVLGQHHGFSPPIDGQRVDGQIFGGPPWQAQRAALLDELKQRLDMDWPQIDTPEQARLLAGLTSVADWIGSGQHFEDPNQPWQDKIDAALDEAGFIAPGYRQGLSFAQIFGFTPRAAQSQLIEVVEQPGAYVLEAPMGMGKTEAALYAAYRMLQSGQACGIYFALPTQLTSNKIHQRFSAFLDRILAEQCQHRALLLHAAAWMLDTEMGEEGRPGGAWFSQAKRGLLAPFAVGTIDQALMAAMNVKHGFVRAFGLAGKVVILDEVHSYDAYTGTLLDALVSLLRSLHCTVIILSATLNRSRRSQLLGCQLSAQDYPLITAVSQGQTPREMKVPTGTDPQQVQVQLQAHDPAAIDEALARAAGGQQVLWIENTVKQAQQRYLDLASRACELGIACGLLHSRYLMADRARIEAHWVDAFGKPGWDKRGERGRILVGTQVLEQSLDIDADFLLSRFAPSDMLLQRLGRLWRHAKTPRAAGACCEAWLLAPELQQAIASPLSAFGASAHVYSSYVLCRSLEAWQNLAQLSLPQDIRGLIESTYAERDELQPMSDWLAELDNGTRTRKGRRALQQLARIGLASNGKTLPEAQAQTRYSESDSCEVLLLRDMQILPGEQASRLQLLDGSELRLPHRRGNLSKPQWRALGARLMQQIVLVHPHEAPAAVSRDTLENYGLQHCFYLGDPNWAEDQSLLRLALVDASGNLRGLHGAALHDKHILHYRDDLGYRAIKADKE